MLTIIHTQSFKKRNVEKTGPEAEKEGRGVGKAVPAEGNEGGGVGKEGGGVGKAGPEVEKEGPEVCVCMCYFYLLYCVSCAIVIVDKVQKHVIY